jgi:serine/threonine protein kinase
LVTVIHALVAVQAVAQFIDEQHERWELAFAPTLEQPQETYEPEAQRVERYCKEHSIEVKLPEFAFLSSPLPSQDCIQSALGAEVRLQVGTMTQHAFYIQWVGVTRDNDKCVALKLQRTRHHLVELNALRYLQGVTSVVQVLGNYTVDAGQMVLVHELLRPVDYKDLEYDVSRTRQFAVVACDILVAIHSRHVFHRDINPWAFKQNGGQLRDA